jgi:hypothetical protein
MLERFFGDCPANIDGSPIRGFVVYQLPGEVLVACKGVEKKGGCDRKCFLEGFVWSLSEAESVALVSAGIKKR